MEVLDLAGRRRRRQPWPISEVAIGIRDEIRDEVRSQDEAEEDEAKDEENEGDEDGGMVARAVLPVLSRHALANARGKIAPGEARDSRVPTQREEDSHGKIERGEVMKIRT